MVPPPDDPIFTSPPPAPAASPTTAPADPPPAAPPTAPAAPNADLAALQQTVNSLTGGFGELKSTLEQVVQRLTPQQPLPAEGSEEWMNKFYTDPQGAVRSVVEGSAAPLVSQVASATSDLQLREYATKIDSEFGSGAYDAIIKSHLDPIVAKAVAGNPQILLNKIAVEATVDSLIGKHRQALAQHKEKAQADRGASTTKEMDAQVVAALQRQGIDPSTLSGGIRRVSPDNMKLSSEHDEYLAGQLKEAGREVDPKRAAVMMNTGNTIDDWEKANTSLAGGKTS